MSDNEVPHCTPKMAFILTVCGVNVRHYIGKLQLKTDQEEVEQF